MIQGPFSYGFQKREKRTEIKQFDGQFFQFKYELGEEVLWKHDPSFDDRAS